MLTINCVKFDQFACDRQHLRRFMILIRCSRATEVPSMTQHLLAVALARGKVRWNGRCLSRPRMRRAALAIGPYPKTPVLATTNFARAVPTCTGPRQTRPYSSITAGSAIWEETMSAPAIEVPTRTERCIVRTFAARPAEATEEGVSDGYHNRVG
jgi:hypothetical protein